MMAVPRSRKIWLGVLIVLALILSGAAWLQFQHEQQVHNQPIEPAQPLALFGTVPIYWGENEGLDDLINDTSEPHWARPVLEQRFSLNPLDTLAEASLNNVARLFMPQPRALSAQENVALDEWVRGGGELLLLADPMITSHSHFGLGDKRRAQDVALLSPILARWGLVLEFDAEQPAGVALVRGVGDGYPTNLSGRLALQPDTSGPDTQCQLIAENLIAQCTIGQGRALIVADAAVLDDPIFATPLLELTDAAFRSREVTQ